MLQATTYEERIRKETIMKEVLPDKAMWEAWEATEAPLRKGRGWYPALDKRFLELLVETEIDLHSIAHDASAAFPLERCERNRDKIRRVAQARIGQERLEAYCARVSEAFTSYIRGGGWAAWDSGEDDDRSSNASASSIKSNEGIVGGAGGDVEVDMAPAGGHDAQAVGNGAAAPAAGPRDVLIVSAGGGMVALGGPSGGAVSKEAVVPRGRDPSPKRVARTENSIDITDKLVTDLPTSKRTPLPGMEDQGGAMEVDTPFITSPPTLIGKVKAVTFKDDGKEGEKGDGANDEDCEMGGMSAEIVQQ